MMTRPLPRIVLVAVAVLALTGCTSPSPAALDIETVPAEVIAVVDGDTIDVRTNDDTGARVRFIGLDSPEIGRHGGPDDQQHDQ